MREIKFEVCTRRKDGTDLFTEILTLNQLLDRNGCYYSPSIQEIVYKRQYTGLKDKNGKEIYEGDFIVITESDRITYYGQGFITFKEGAFFINDMLLNDIISESLVCIVTSNIHEN